MNILLEYLRYFLIALLLLCIPVGLAISAIRVGLRGNRNLAIACGVLAGVLSIPIGRFAISTLLMLLLLGPPPSEAQLIADFEHQTGVTLPASAKVTSYRTAYDFLAIGVACSRPKSPARSCSGSSSHQIFGLIRISVSKRLPDQGVRC
ncbi:MAG: hypothetical protein AAGG53_03760 [Cyanobacteria bacterium P01_H01_bin.152]